MKNMCFASLMLATILTGCMNANDQQLGSSGTTAVNGEKQMFTTVDGLLREQARDLARRMGWIDDESQPFPDYDVEVYYGGPVVGSLIENQYGNLINSSACSANTVSETELNAFSSYTLNSSLALQLGLPIPSLPIGLTAKNDITTSYSLADAKLKLLDQDELEALIKTPACSARIAKATKAVWIVRGIITAKRTYNFSRKGSGGATLSVPGSSNSFTSERGVAGAGTDSAARAYFMILSPVKVIDTTAPVDKSGDGGICNGNFGNPLFIQRDATDAKDTGVGVRTALGGKFSVEKRIQPQTVMPDHTEVRYYYDSDMAAANCALSILKSNGYPKAILNRRDRAAPAKLLEVWLARS